MRTMVMVIVALVWVAVPCDGDVFMLRDGRQIEGSVARTTPEGRVTITMKTGVRSHHVSEFAPETVEEHFPDELFVSGSGKVLRLPRDRIDLSGSERKTLWGMAIVGLGLFVIGLIWLTVAAFAESPAWGIAFIISGGSAELAFIILHWKRARAPFLTQVFGLVLLVSAIVLLVRGGGWGSVLPWHVSA